MEPKTSVKDTLFGVLLSAIIVTLPSLAGWEYWKLDQEKTRLEATLLQTKEEYASTSNALLLNIATLRELLATTTIERDNLEENLRGEQVLIEAMQLQIESVSGTVGTLAKLSSTDKELLKKYSRVYFLNENFIPKTLMQIPAQYVFQPEKDKWILGDVLPPLVALLDAATADGIDLRVLSAYRSFGEQSTLKSTYSMLYGAGTANKFSADQGYSEHQLGTTVDFTTRQLGSKFTTFEGDSGYRWLTIHAHEYGFVLSYPKSNKYYVFEPWHWRFVGKELAAMLHTNNKFFYDLEQREIDQYLISIFDR